MVTPCSGGLWGGDVEGPLSGTLCWVPGGCRDAPCVLLGDLLMLIEVPPLHVPLQVQG